MEDIEISARIHLDKLRVVRTDDGWVAGSADEPYLWFVVIKVDGSTIELGVPPTAHVDIDATSAAPGNLGPASQGVPAGTTIAIPTAVGTLETTLRGGAGAAVSLTRFATFVIAVAAMEHDETRAQDVIALRSRIIADSRDKLNDELRQIVQEFIDGEIPSAADVEKRLRHQISEDEIEKIVKDFFGELFGQPVNLINHDVFVGYNTDTVVNFPKLLASSLTGIPIDVRLERGNDPDRPRYHLWGAVERRSHRPSAWCASTTSGCACAVAANPSARGSTSGRPPAPGATDGRSVPPRCRREPPSHRVRTARGCMWSGVASIGGCG